MFLLLAGALANCQVDGRLFGRDCELVDVLPPLGLKVLAFLLFSFLFLLELHLLITHTGNCTLQQALALGKALFFCNQIYHLISVLTLSRHTN